MYYNTYGHTFMNNHCVSKYAADIVKIFLYNYFLLLLLVFCVCLLNSSYNYFQILKLYTTDTVNLGLYFFFVIYIYIYIACIETCNKNNKKVCFANNTQFMLN